MLDLELSHIEPKEIIVTKEEDSVRYMLSILIDMAELFKKNTESIVPNTTDESIDCEVSRTVQNDSSFITRNLNENLTEMRYKNEDEDKKENYVNPNDKDEHEDKVNVISSQDKENKINEKCTETNQCSNYCKNFSFNKNKEKEISDIGIKIEIIYLLKKMYKHNEYKSMMNNSDYHNRITKCINKIKIFHKSVFKDNQPMTKQFLKQNSKEISKIVKNTFTPSCIDVKKNLPMKIAMAIIDDKIMLQKICELEADVLRQNINNRKEKYITQKEISDQHLKQVKEMYIQALRMEEDKVREEIKNLNQVNTLKEEKIVLENKATNEYMIEKKEYLKELERYEKFKREKENKIKRLKIDSSI